MRNVLKNLTSEVLADILIDNPCFYHDGFPRSIPSEIVGEYAMINHELHIRHNNREVWEHKEAAKDRHRLIQYSKKQTSKS